MKGSLQITFHGMERSDAIEEIVRRRCEHLERFAGDILSCRVVVDQLQQHQRQGRPFGVRIDLTLSGLELAVDRLEDEDVRVAVRGAFDAMERRLEGAVRRRRGDDKWHAPPPSDGTAPGEAAA